MAEAADNPITPTGLLGHVGTTDVGTVTPAAARTLLNVASGATANATDAQLRDRATHTGTQATSTVTGLDAALAAGGALSDLSDVDTAGRADGDTLVWDAAAGAYVSEALPSGGGTAGAFVHTKRVPGRAWSPLNILGGAPTAMNALQEYLVPIVYPLDITNATSLVITVTTAQTAAQIRLALHALNTNGTMGTQLAVGTLSGATTGPKTLSLSGVTHVPGSEYVALVCCDVASVAVIGNLYIVRQSFLGCETGGTGAGRFYGYGYKTRANYAAAAPTTPDAVSSYGLDFPGTFPLPFWIA